VVGSLATYSSIPTWYAELNRTAITPPNWVFGPAWTLLYILMAIAAFLVWREGLENPAVKHRLVLFFEQLVLNALWSIIFFGQHQILFAFIALVVLWLAILATILKFYQISKLAAYLLIPYILWVTFAGVLNFMTWLANK
jgi:tryptophan-rich sensory protein